MCGAIKKGKTNAGKGRGAGRRQKKEVRIRLFPCLPESATDALLPPSAAFSLPSTVSLAPMLLWSLKAPPLVARGSLRRSLTPAYMLLHRWQTNRIWVNARGASLDSRTKPLLHVQVSRNTAHNKELYKYKNDHPTVSPSVHTLHIEKKIKTSELCAGLRLFLFNYSTYCLE